MTSSTLRFDHLQHQFEENPRRHFVPLAHAFLRAGNARRAVELCRTFLPQLPGHVSGHVVLAEALRALGADDDARAEYERVLALDAENLVAVRALGDLAAARGNAMEARGWYARLVELDPRDAGATARLEELGRAAIAPTSAPYDAVERHVLDERAEAVDVDAADVPGADRDQMLAEEFTAGFFASVLDEPVGAPPRGDEPRFAPDLDHLLPDAPPLPGADELHATLSAPRDDAARRDEGVRALSSLPEPTRPDLAAYAPAREPAPPAPEEPPTFVSALRASDAAADEPEATADGGDSFESLASFGLGDAPPAPAATPDVGDAVPATEPIMAEFPEDAAAAGELGAAGTGPAFVTETMAELYLRQGFRAEAADVYRQLLAQAPDDERLQARVAELAEPAAATTDAAPIAAEPAAAPFADVDDVVGEFGDAEGEPIVPGPAADATDAGAPTWLEAEPPAPAALAANASDADAAIDDAPSGSDASAPAEGAAPHVSGFAAPERDRSTGRGPSAPPAITVSAWLSRLVTGAAGVSAAATQGATPEEPAAAPAAADDWSVAPAAAHDWSAAPAGTDGFALVDDAATEEEVAAAEANDFTLVEEVAPVDDVASGGHVAPGADVAGMDDVALMDDVAFEDDVPSTEDVVFVQAPPAEREEREGGAAEPGAHEEALTLDATLIDDGGAVDEIAPLGAALPGVAPTAEPPAFAAGAGADHAAADASWDDPFAWDEPEVAATAPAAPSAAAPFSLDELFARPASADDESAAGSLAAATLGLAADDEMRARFDAAAAEDERSIGAVLRATPPGVPAAPPPGPATPESADASARPGASFSFEQFFRPTPAAGGPTAQPAPPAPAPDPAAARDDDLDEFHRWLAGLSDA